MLRGCRPWERCRRHIPGAADAGRGDSSRWNMGWFQRLVSGPCTTGSRAPRPGDGTSERPCPSRPADEDRMLDHRIEDLVLADIGPGQAKLFRKRFFRAQTVARADPRAIVEALELFAARRLLQIFDDLRLGAAFAKDFERLARCSAERIVINRYVHVTESS